MLSASVLEQKSWKNDRSPAEETASSGRSKVNAREFEERRPAGGDGPVNTSAGRMISRYTRRPVSHNLQM